MTVCRRVDLAKLKILRKRLTECNVYWGESSRAKCEPERKNFEENQIRWYIKCECQIFYVYDVRPVYIVLTVYILVQIGERSIGQKNTKIVLVKLC